MNRKLISGAAVLATSAVAASAALAASSPSVSSVSASSITSSSAVLKGTVNPNSLSTSDHFEWGLTTAYGLASQNHSVGHGSKNVSVQTTAGKLLPGTTYHFRIVATNKAGTTVGSDHTLRTAGKPPPDVATGSATQLGPFGAELTGVVNPHGASTTYVFQYGLTPAYGFLTFSGTVAAGGAPTIVAGRLSGLQPGATFHYRLVAYHGTSTPQYGADATFMTLPFPRPKPRVRASTNPRRDGKAPFRFTTFGRVSGPRRFARSLDCIGSTSIRFLNGKHQVAASVVPLQPDCTFSADTTFRHLPGRGKGPRSVRLKVLIQFRGNGYLAPAGARTEFVTLSRR